MNWSNSWASQQETTTIQYLANPLDALSQDELIVKHIALKRAVEEAKNAEMELRKYIVNRAFPEKHEGTNTLELGNGYSLKAGVKFNYKLADNDTVEKTLDAISAIGNEGPFIAERLVSWTPNFLLTEYRKLQEEASTNATAKAILDKCTDMLTITDAAPTLELREPKVKK
jgi:hypothetical protein